MDKKYRVKSLSKKSVRVKCVLNSMSVVIRSLTRSLQSTGKRVFCEGTNRHTHRHMTHLQLREGRFSENLNLPFLGQVVVKVHRKPGIVAAGCRYSDVFLMYGKLIGTATRVSKIY